MKLTFRRVQALLSILILLGGILPAHGEWNDSIRWKAEVNATFSTGQETPFWLVSNLQGLPLRKKTTDTCAFQHSTIWILLADSRGVRV